jgi:hypothetical protein
MRSHLQELWCAILGLNQLNRFALVGGDRLSRVATGPSWKGRPHGGLGRGSGPARSTTQRGLDRSCSRPTRPRRCRRRVHPVAHSPRQSTAAAHPLPSRLAKSRHQSQLGVDGLDMACAEHMVARRSVSAFAGVARPMVAAAMAAAAMRVARNNMLPNPPVW